MTQVNEHTLRNVIAKQMRTEIEPLLSEDTYDGGYNCCGCGSYGDILEHAIKIVLNQQQPKENNAS